MNIGTMSDEYLDNLCVTSVTCHMKWLPAIAISGLDVDMMADIVAVALFSLNTGPNRAVLTSISSMH